MKRYWKIFTSVFIYNEKVYWPLVALYCTINLLVLFNSTFHNPFIAYDAIGHINYVETLSQGILPERESNHEFFSPPLTYVVPAALKASGMDLRDSVRAGLFINFFTSLGITYLVLKVIRRLSPEDPKIQILALLMLGMLPAYYKTLAFLRGEPLITLFTLLIIELSIRIFAEKDFRQKNVITLGVALGLSILSRQWAFFIFPALILLACIIAFYNKECRKNIFNALAISIMIAYVLGAWFYIGLIVKYKTVTAFNRGPIGVENLSPSFFTGMGDINLFTNPIRPSYTDQFWPIMHSEIWGDYWGYFSIYARNKNTGDYQLGWDLAELTHPLRKIQTNKFTFNRYLGRVNAISLFPSVLLIIGLIYGIVQIIKMILYKTDANGLSRGLMALIVVFTLAGYIWFMIQYPAPGKGDTTKASYILNIFPLLALLIASFFQHLSTRWKWNIWPLIFFLALIMLYDTSAMITHIIYFPW